MRSRTGWARLAGVCLALVALTACREDFFDPTPGVTDATSPGAVELIAENVRLIGGEEHAIRIGFAPADPAARIRVERSADGGRIVACALARVEDPLPDPSTCLPDLPDGVREPITTGTLGAVALIRIGDPLTVGIRIEFVEARRSFAFRLPVVDVPAGASACKDNACNPFFEVTPVRGGAFAATAKWAGGNGTLALLEGRVLARSFTSTGIPYRIAATASGPPPLSIRATLNAPSEYALALQNASSEDLRLIEIDATWP